MALPGISNANEFYSAHYLESVLAGDIKKVRERWAEEAKAQLEADLAAGLSNATASTPEAQFKALRKPWQKLREAEIGITEEPAERLRLQRELFFQPLLEALGYPYAPKAEPVLIGGEAYQVPLLGEVSNAKGEPWLWVVECFNPSDEPADPLELTIATRWGCQIDDPSLGTVLTDGDGQGSETWEELISERIFGQEIPPRWVLAVSRDQLLLIDRQKWAASRLLRFELGTLLGENNPDALLAAATLLHREHTCPTGGGTPLLDELDENSHKHAYEVSADLKYALRRSIELLGNEVVAFIKAQKKGVYEERLDPEQLTLELLRFMYRLLFLFFIESRPKELGYAPMGNDVYRLGYSLESLRDLDTAELASEEDRESTYISESLDRLFQMIWEGYPKRGEQESVQADLTEAKPEFDTFQIVPLRSHLFDPERLPIINGLLKDDKGDKRWPKVRFRNAVLRQVIEMMSLTKEGKGKRRGRVSYSQLGINQLGAVYEALLSFRGFFAEEDLYEVQPAPKKGKAAASDDDDDFDDSGNGDDQEDDDNTKASGQAHDELEVGHFVTAEQLKDYKAEEIVPDLGTGKPKCHLKGSFIYRLAGRDREKSASYYTPESLTQCLVKYALKELLPGKTAADILQLKVCEPAMGSAAFLNEVVNQLAQKYLELRQQETGKSIPHEQFATELQKVKMRLADQNVFGVDLNPVAVELAEVSLWLNSIFTPENGRAFVPWFSQQLVCGNSLIGARRQIYRVNHLPIEVVIPSKGKSAKPKTKAVKPSKLWHEHAPEELAWDAELPKDGIFHFLLPDPGMAAYTDKVIKELEPDAIDRCKRWNKAFVGEQFNDAQIAHLLRLSKLVDALWKDWAEQQRQLRQRTTDPLPVWEDPTGAQEGDWTPLKLKDRIQEQEVLGRDVANTNARLRLKWAMDYWVALWFWPIRQAGSLPSRDTWLLELSMILGDLEQGVTPEPGQGSLFADTQPQQLAVDFSDRHGFVDVEKLKTEFERLRQVEDVANRIRPLHWDLEFADLLSNGGFDLALGNPPWMRSEWSQDNFLSEKSPMLSKDFDGRKESELNHERKRILAKTGCELMQEYETAAGTKSILPRKFFLSSGNFNHYRCFIELIPSICNESAVLAMVHDCGIFENRQEPRLRTFLYPRLKYLFRFVNQIVNGSKLFPDLDNNQKFELSVYNSKKNTGANDTYFTAIFSLFSPSTIEGCLGEGDITLAQSKPAFPEGIKNSEGKWNTRGEKARAIQVTPQLLSVMSLLTSGDSSGWHSTEIISVFRSEHVTALEAFSNAKQGSSLIAAEALPICNEKECKKLGLIDERPGWNNECPITLLSGPNISLGNCFAQQTKLSFAGKRSYQVVSAFSAATEGFEPRTQYNIFNQSLFINRFFGDRENLLNEYKLAFRTMININQERSLLPAIMPPSFFHVYSITSLSMKTIEDLLYVSAWMASIPIDFYIKVLGKTTLYASDIPKLPIPLSSTIKHSIFSEICKRAARLNSVSHHFHELIRFSSEKFGPLMSTPLTQPDCYRCEEIEVRPLSDLARRNLTIELDVLCAMALGLNIAELVSIYTVQFPVARQYEKQTFYDAKGMIVFTVSKGLTGVGFPRKGSGRGPSKTTGWEDIADQKSGAVSRTILDDTLPGEPVERTITYEAPFDRCDRVVDYQIAWDFFEKEGIGA